MDNKREVRSFLVSRDPSIDRRYRPCPQMRERLFAEIEEDDYDETDSESLEDENDDAQSSCSSDAVETGALVYLRFKPVEMPSPAYSIDEDNKILVIGPSTGVSSSSKNKNTMEKHFSFSEIFDSEVTQFEVYEKCIGDKISSEESFTVLTYGTSGSGKTFTLLGDDIRPGIIPRALEHIFTIYKDNIHPSPLSKLVNARTTFLDDTLVQKECMLRRIILDNCKNLDANYPQLQLSVQLDHGFKSIPLGNVSVFVWVTFVEIYNELVYDLLEPIKSNVTTMLPPNVSRKNLKIVCNDGNVFIKGVTSVYIKNSSEALKLLRSGLQKVTYASTSINANSSRSHCVFFVDVLKYFENGVYTETSYKFCDLAGSERLDKTGNIGSRLKEAQRINASLMVLGRCLDAANNSTFPGSTTLSSIKKERIPFRESKLTMILQAALQGREKLTMIVNVTPTEKYYEENMNVLNFASIARNIIFKAPVLKQPQKRFSMLSTTQDNGYIQQLLAAMAELTADNEKLKNQLEQKNKQIEMLEEVMDENYDLKAKIDRLAQQHEEDLFQQEQRLRNELVDSGKSRLEEYKLQSELRMKREIENKVRIYETRIEFLKRRHKEELEDLREELAGKDDETDGEEAADAENSE